jgi:hypothetical protein
MVSALSRIESNYIKNINSVCKLFYFEAMRQFGDRILMNHDLKKLTRAIKSICVQHLCDEEDNLSDVDLTSEEKPREFEDFPIESPDKLWFSTLNDEVEG